MADHDVVVVGGGPAGAATALSARRLGLDVLVLDAASFPRDKVCGDGVAPHALEVLAGLGVDTAKLVEGSTPIDALRMRSPGGETAVRRPSARGYVVPREVFDHRLLCAAVAAGAQVRQHAVRRIEDRGDVVDVDGISARVVVGADGAESVVRRSIDVAPQGPGTVALAIRGYAPDVGPVGEQLLTMTAQHWPAYGWAFPIGDGRSNVGYGELLQGAPPTRAFLDQRMRALLPGVDPERVRGHRLPLSTGRPALPDGRILLAGDAAGLINPLTGEGIFYAALSGSLAGAAAADGAHAGATYRRRLTDRLGRHLRHTDIVSRLCRRPWFLDAGVRAARRYQHPFDTIWELGLGEGRLDVRSAATIGWSALRR